MDTPTSGLQTIIRGIIICIRVHTVTWLTLGAHAQRGLVRLCFVSVCVSTLILALQATRRPISDTSGFRTTRAWKINGQFSWSDCVRERETGWSRTELRGPTHQLTVRMHIERSSWPRPGSLALCILKAQEVTTKGMYRLPHAIYYSPWAIY